MLLIHFICFSLTRKGTIMNYSSKMIRLNFRVLLLSALVFFITASASAQLAEFRISLWFSDSLGKFPNPDLRFGVHPEATDCVDPSLGEFFMFTECGLFSQHCAYFAGPLSMSCGDMDYPVFLDLRKSWSSSQADTFWIRYVGTSPVVLHWPKTIGTCFDSCRLYGCASFLIPQIPQPLNIDMLTVDSAVIPSYDIWGIIIRTVGPKIPTSVQESIHSTPGPWILSTNYPNPFNPTTLINYQLPMNSYVTIKVYNVLGREVAALVNEYKAAGKYEVELNASNLSSGIYFYKLSAKNYTSVKKMVLIR
jgi:hypothetical protein